MDNLTITPQNTDLKTCTKCKVEKRLEEFYFRKDTGNHNSYCKTCRDKQINIYYKKNKKTLNIKHNIWNQQNKEKMEIWREQNKEDIRNKKKIYYQYNKIKIQEKKRIYNKRLYKTNTSFKLLKNIKGRILLALKHNSKFGSTISLLGCDIEKAKKHLESLWKRGMSWENHAVNGWHIDHIKPCSSFDLTNPDEQKICFHYTNLQPLWATTDIARKNGDFESIGNLNKGDFL